MDYHHFDKSRPHARREAKTISAMFAIYCRRTHKTSEGLCDDCQELQDYALSRLDRCPFQEDKSTCANCAVHCYKPEMRERVRIVMRETGPIMALKHPILSFMHLVIDSKRKPGALD